MHKPAPMRRTNTDPTGASGHIPSYGNPSPETSALSTPANNSPTHSRPSNSNSNSTTPQHNVQPRQLRPLKSPMYVPAVLRQTNYSTKSPPITPPRSVHGSIDDALGGTGAGGTRGPMSKSVTLPSGEKKGVSKMAEVEWLNEQNLGEVVGSPTRDHWKADSASPSCDSPVCKSFFGLFNRRHHCRHCGHVFCAVHTPHTVPLDQNARYHPDGTPSRTCDMCWDAYCRWDQGRIDRLNQIQNSLSAKITGGGGTGGGGDGTRPITRDTDSDHGSVSDGSLLTPTIEHQDSVIATSVPRDWSWSTF